MHQNLGEGSIILSFFSFTKSLSYFSLVAKVITIAVAEHSGAKKEEGRVSLMLMLVLT